ncbi:DEAD/DEAH box helicase [Brevibacterium aurantiacum]|nr:SNF2-related protein [Brevibacterium aurantiacum]
MTVVPTDEIIDLGGPGAFSRGTAYANQGRVLRAVWYGNEQQLVGDVVGSSGLYRTMIEFEDFEDGEPGEIVSTDCSCPVGGDCKHCVALLLFNNTRTPEQDDSGGHRLPGRQAPDPVWKQQLDRVVEASNRTSSVPDTPLALGFELHRPPNRRYFQPQTPARLKVAEIPDEPEPQVHIRPLVPGSKSNWIKGQAGWHWFTTRMNSARFDSEQFEWFFRLATLDDSLGYRGYSSSSTTITLDDFASTFLWDLLAQTADLDIPLVSTDRQITIRLGERAQFHIDITSRSEDLVVSPEVSIDDRPVPLETVRPIGNAGVHSLALTGKSRAILTLAPLSTRLSPGQQAMLSNTSATEIPASAHEDFFDRVLPLLRPPRGQGQDSIISSDDSVEVPVERQPHLNLQVSYDTTTGRGSAATGRGGSAKETPKTSARLEWSWTYYSPKRMYPLVAVQSEFADPQHSRDSKFEQAVLQKVRGIQPDAARTESATLTGIEVAKFTTRILPQLYDLDDVEVTITGQDGPPEFRELEAAPSITVRTSANDDSDWFDLGIDVTIEGHEIPFVTLFKALATDETHLMLDDGSYFSLDNSAFDKLRELLAEAASLDGFKPENPQLSRYQAGLYEDLEELADDVAEDPRWSGLMDGLRQIDSIAEVAVPDTVNAQLRQYQVEGFRWLAFLHEHNLGGILADDMGLGKTLQTLALVDHDRGQREEPGPAFLVVAPTSVVANWVLEARKFTPHLNVTAVAETAKKRKSPVAEVAAGADIVVTSYAVMRLDIDEFAGHDWAGVIFDEAQFMKNNQAKTHRAARRIAAPFRLAITGTPMENSLTDVWSLAAITAPGLFPAAKQFKEDYVKPIESGDDPDRMTRLRSRLRPFMLRRTKDLVAADLPAKQEQVLTVELEPQHRRLYDTVLQHERKQVLGLLGDFEKNRFAIFRSLTLLRMLALDPGIVADHADSGIGSSKLTVLMEYLNEITAEGHRALVFSQFTSYLRRVAAELEAGGIDFVYLDGSTTDRTKVIEAFRQGSAPVFLISLKAGGIGLTLTEADYVFLLDPWWNPAAESQAIDRTHRIGQTRNVMVYRLVAEHTIEEKVLALQAKKAELFTALMDNGSAFNEVISAADIKGLLEA